MTGAVARLRGVAAGALTVLFASCQGGGSDIGPRLSRLPNASCKAVVLDDEGRGVVGATVAIVGTAMRAVTGRNGRGDLLADPRGRVLVDVDGSAGAAVAGDRLARLRVAATITGPDLPLPFHLSALPDAASALLNVGTQAAATPIASAAGAVLTVGAGSSVGVSGGSAQVTVRLGDLRAVHLPGDLPTSLAGPRLFTAGVLVWPLDATFTAGAHIDVADTLGVGVTPAALYHLDPEDGEWDTVPVTVVAAGGRLTAAGGVLRGGLYTFGVEVGATVVSGLARTPLNVPVPGAIVRLDQVRAVTDANGAFTLVDVPAALGNGGARTASLEVFGGGDWLPAITRVDLPLIVGSTDAGIVTLDTLRAGNVRMQQIVRARSDPLQSARLSSFVGGVALGTVTDAAGQAIFEDVPAGLFGWQDGRSYPGSSAEVLYGQAAQFLQVGQRWLDSYRFQSRRGWYAGSRNVRTVAVDAVGGGPLPGITIVQGATAGQGFIGVTGDGASFFANRAFATRATATLRSEREGRVVVHALSITQPDSDHLELPMRQALRTPIGAFDRHGIAAGVLVGADPARAHELRATRRITRQEWWDDIAGAAPLRSAVPLDLDPDDADPDNGGATGSFRIGVDAVGGNIAAAELTTGPRTLRSLGLLESWQPVEGAVTGVDLTLDHPANQPFVLQGALTDVDPRVDTGALTFALGLAQDPFDVLDAARGLDGGYVPSGADLQFQLPALNGGLLGRSWLLLLSGATTDASGRWSHQSLVELAGATSAAPFRFRPFPTITSPAPNGVVDAAGFTVGLSLPTGCVVGTIELRSENGGELLLWEVFVKPAATEFAFVALPVRPDQTATPTPLIAGRTYDLTVSAWFGQVTNGSIDNYPSVVAFQQSIGLLEAGLRQVTRCTIQVSTP